MSFFEPTRMLSAFAIGFGASLSAMGVSQNGNNSKEKGQ